MHTHVENVEFDYLELVNNAGRLDGVLVAREVNGLNSARYSLVVSLCPQNNSIQ